jgi:hypothetical protein
MALVLSMMGNGDIHYIELAGIFIVVVAFVGGFPDFLMMRILRPDCPECGKKLSVDGREHRRWVPAEDPGIVNYNCDCGFHWTGSAG